MKNLMLVLFVLLSSTSLLSQVNEQQAIVRVLDQETKAYYDGDFETWANCWSKENVHFLYADQEAAYFYDTWEALANDIKQSMGEKHQFSRSNYSFCIAGDMAWVSFESVENNHAIREQRTLVKEEGAWKLINMTAVDLSTYKTQNGQQR